MSEERSVYRIRHAFLLPLTLLLVLVCALAVVTTQGDNNGTGCRSMGLYPAGPDPAY